MTEIAKGAAPDLIKMALQRVDRQIAILKRQKISSAPDSRNS